MNEAPMSGFPAKRRQKDPGMEAGAAAQPGMGMPPPPVPPAPDVPAMPLTHENGFGMNAGAGEPGGYATMAPWSALNPQQGPLSGSAGKNDILGQRYDLKLPPKNEAPDSNASTGTAVAAPPVTQAPVTRASLMQGMEAPTTDATGSDRQKWLDGNQAEYDAAVAAPQVTPTAADIEASKHLPAAAQTGPAQTGAAAAPTAPSSRAFLMQGMDAGAAGSAEQGLNLRSLVDRQQADAAGAGGVNDGGAYQPNGPSQAGATPDDVASWDFTTGTRKPGYTQDANGKWVNATGDKNTDTGTDKGTGTDTGTKSTGPATVTPPSTNPADYKPTQTAAGSNQDQWNQTQRDWLTKHMGVENPYDSEYVKQGLAVAKDSIDRETAAGLRQIEEHFASRGLTGSSLEATEVANYKAQMMEQYRAEAFKLTEAQAKGYLDQEQTVGGLARDYGANLTDQQKVALDDIHQQISNQLQKYGIDKQSADSMAHDQVSKEIAAADRTAQTETGNKDRTSRETMQTKDLIAQYWEAPSSDQWDAYAKAYGNDAATQDLGVRPQGATGGTGGTGGAGGTGGTGGTGTGGTGGAGNGSTGATKDPWAMSGDFASDLAQAKQYMKPPTSLDVMRKVYDAFAAKYGVEAQVSIGSRP